LFAPQLLEPFGAALPLLLQIRFERLLNLLLGRPIPIEHVVVGRDRPFGHPRRRQ
jgi:hypothetical protein